MDADWLLWLSIGCSAVAMVTFVAVWVQVFRQDRAKRRAEKQFREGEPNDSKRFGGPE